MRIGLPISVTDRSQISNLPADTQILKWRTTWRNLPSIFLIQHDFDYLPRFFSVSRFGDVSAIRLPPPPNAALQPRPLAGVGCKRWLGGL
jgi:hypothetical protein